MPAMQRLTSEQRRKVERLDRESLRGQQLEQVNRLLATILPHNRFYAGKFSAVAEGVESWDDFVNLPYTFKDELLEGAGEFAANLTWPVDRYTRLHRTSGTRGRPLIVLDTVEDWQWWIDGWQFVLDAAEITSHDRALMAFSFGPFIGFWSAYDALADRGAMLIPTGALGSVERLETIKQCAATVLFCTPSYALRLAEVAAEARIDTAALGIRRVVVAGEPGGSTPAVRERIETAWSATVSDHAGASEVGPWGYADPAGRGLIVNENHFLPEFLSVESGRPAGEGELAELVLTTLGRAGSPVIRYRTGDLVRPHWPGDDAPNRFVHLPGGVLGRADDMMIIRGVNVFPSSIDQILRGFPEIVEYRMTVRREHEMDQLSIEIEDRLDDPARVAHELQLRLGLRIDVQTVPLGSLPRFEAKGRRFIDQR